MVIIGHGVDIVEIERIEKLLSRFPRRFPRRVCVQSEADYCFDRPAPAESLAARLAAKEAVYKALSPNIEVLNWREIVILSGRKGRPELELSGGAAEAAGNLNITDWHISLSHERDYALASVIAEGGR